MLRSIGIAALSIGLFASTALAEYASQPKALTPEETAFCEALGEGAAMFAGHRLIGNTLAQVLAGLQEALKARPQMARFMPAFETMAVAAYAEKTPVLPSEAMRQAIAGCQKGLAKR